MMGITVSDIEQKEFAFKGAGYDPYDVDSYLDQICDEMVAMQERIDELEEALRAAKMEAKAANEGVKPIPQEVKRTEDEEVPHTSAALERILLSAQRISDDAVDSAKRQAKELMDEAKKKADETLKNVKEEKSTIEKEIVTLRSAAADYKKRFLGLLNEHKALLETDGSILSDTDENEEEPKKK